MQINRSIHQNNDLSQNLPILIKAVSETNLNIARDTYTIHEVLQELKAGAIQLTTLNKLDIIGLNQLSAGKELITARVRQAKFTSATNEFKILLDVTEVDPNITLFRAVSFKNWTDSGDSYTIYPGNSLLKHNHTCNCSKLISENLAHRESGEIDFRCSIRDLGIQWWDLKLQKINVNDENRERETNPTIIRHRDERLVQCMGHKIKLNGSVVRCGSQPFSIPIHETLEIDNLLILNEIAEVSLTGGTPNEERLLIKEVVDRSFIEALKVANDNLDRSTRNNEELKKMNEVAKVLKFIEDNQALTVGMSTTSMLLMTGLIAGCYALCKKDPFIRIIESQIVAETARGSRAQTNLGWPSMSMPNLTIHIGNKMETNEAPTAEIDIADTTLYPDLEELTLGMDANKSCKSEGLTGSIKSLSGETLRLAKRATRFKPTIGSCRRLTNLMRPPTTHPFRTPKRKVPPKKHYAGKTRTSTPNAVTSEFLNCVELPPPNFELANIEKRG